jgi:hypothetical protein
VWFRTHPILRVLDDCASSFNFPVLDNGYVYLAASRLSAYAAPPDWALVIEIFGFSPRAGLPDVSVYTFANRLHARNAQEEYASPAAYEKYLKANPHNEFRSAFPIGEGDWQDAEDLELVSPVAQHVPLRDALVRLPSPDDYISHGIMLEDPASVRVHELCRYLAATRRGEVLGKVAERRVSVLPDLPEILVCDAWTHPDVSGGERPSQTETFRQLARVLETADASKYRPATLPNTHWSHWPEGGLL